MSTDPSAAASARLGVAAEESPPTAVALSRRVVAELAATIERLHSLIAGDAMAAPEGSDAIERIADIAFVLHERQVEASLCDTLDAAVREISGGEATRQASLERMRKASEMLRELSGRLNEIMAAESASSSMAPHEPASPGPQSQLGEAADAGVLPTTGVRSDSVSDDGAFTDAVVPLADEFGDRKSSTGEAASELAPCDERAVAAGAPPAGQGSETRTFVAPAANEIDDFDLFATAPNDHPIEAAPITEQTSLLDLLGASSAIDDVSVELFGTVEPDAQTQGMPQPVPDAAESSQVSEAAWLPPPGPEDDPADLFEPVAAPDRVDPASESLEDSEQVPARSADSAAFAEDQSSQGAAAEMDVASGITTATEISADSGKEWSGQRMTAEIQVAGGSPAPSPTGFDATSIYRPPANDPLASVKALSEDELIALFS